ncbi:hypothetical protein DL96DRAFT_1698614 [Flagelloscypha sp. PMI_526]|nr:hypothetical protein DL96DRAFT_1698614 [Flagelloscypha sp. PMI_526]
MSTLVYDPESPLEVAPPLPSAIPVPIPGSGDQAILQAPLSRKGTGPGLILFLPEGDVGKSSSPTTLDPPPIQKWAEEGFAVLALSPGLASLDSPLAGLKSLESLDNKEKFAVIGMYYCSGSGLLQKILAEPEVSGLISYGPLISEVKVPSLVHTVGDEKATGSIERVFKYDAKSNHFVLPASTDFVGGLADQAHSRSLAFVKKHLGGPYFDLEAIWEEHTFHEFAQRSVARTMSTMVAEPYVNHIPTMIGGIGRKKLTEFYRDHFIFSNPQDTKLVPVSRTVGADRVVDEFLFEFTHDCVVPIILPGVPATGKFISIPMVAVVCIRGDRLYNEHIWWDQGTVLKQIGVLPSHLPFKDQLGHETTIRLPVAGAESGQLLLNETSGLTNEMISWNHNEGQ